MNLKSEDNNLNVYTKNDMIKQENTQAEYGRYDELNNETWMNQFEEEPYVTNIKQPDKKEENKKGFKEIISIAILVLMVVGCASWCLISGIKGMFLAPVHPMEDAFTNLVEGDVYEGTISYISPEVGELKHTINFIPVGTEHFYLMFSEDGTKVIPIRASKKWDKEFTSDSIMEVSLQERGIVREMDYKIKSEMMSSIVSDFATAGMKVEPSLYIDLNANNMCMLQIFTGLSLIVCCLYFAILAKRAGDNKDAFKSPIASVMFILLLVTCGVLIYLLNMV